MHDGQPFSAADVKATFDRVLNPNFQSPRCGSMLKPMVASVSEPEPDIAVVRGRIEDYLDAHPSSPVLVVEVADSSLVRDRDRKGSLYARAGVADYWIVNLLGNVLEVYRDPERTAAGRWRYATVRVLKRGAVVSPLAALRARLRVADLLA